MALNMRLNGWVYKFSLPAGIAWVTGRRCPLSRLRGLCSLQHNLVQSSPLVWGSCSFCCLLPPNPRGLPTSCFLPVCTAPSHPWLTAGWTVGRGGEDRGLSADYHSTSVPGPEPRC